MADSSSGSGSSYSSASSSASSSRSSSAGRHRLHRLRRHRSCSANKRDPLSAQIMTAASASLSGTAAAAAAGGSGTGSSGAVVVPLTVISASAACTSASASVDAAGDTAATWPESLIINVPVLGLSQQQQQQLPAQTSSQQPKPTAGSSSGIVSGTRCPKYPLQLDDSEYSSYESLLEGGAGKLKPFCRICHLPGGADSAARPLLSPCRCSGTLQHVHPACLAKWIEASARIRRSLDPAEAERRRREGRRSRRRSPPRCELCNYEYRRRAKFSLSANGGWRLPRVSRGDRVLHLIFLLCVLVMLACAVITVMCFVRDRDRSRGAGASTSATAAGGGTRLPAASATGGQTTPNQQQPQPPMPPQHPHQPPPTPLVLTGYEALTLVSGILFFLAFFTAMSVQIKSRHTVYKLLVKCYRMNISYSFLAYERSKDPMYA